MSATQPAAATLHEPPSSAHPQRLPARAARPAPPRSVVLDEAQLVANSSSVAAVVASSLWRRHAWVVTGTPIASKLDEIKGAPVAPRPPAADAG